MHLLFGFFRTLILLGALQGFIISSLLCLSRQHRQSNRLLAALLLLIALANLDVYLLDASWARSTVFLRVLGALVPLIIIMPIGPLAYFYVRSVSNPDFRFTKKYKAHFYSVFIDLVPQLTALVAVIGILAGWFRNDNPSWGNFIDTYDIYSDIPRWLSLGGYLWLAYRYLIRLKAERLAASGLLPAVAPAFGGVPHYQWLRQFLGVFFTFWLIWFVFLVPYVIPGVGDWLLDTVGWYPIYIPLTVLIYWLGFKGYRLAQQPEEGTKKKKKTVSGVSGRLGPDASTVAETAAVLSQVMEAGKLYLDPALNLSILSSHTGIPAKTISAVLNQYLQKNLAEFVNEYRIREVQERLGKEENRNLTIAGIAYECGFNSQPTFQRAFKAMLGVSPKEFRRNLLSNPDLTRSRP